MQRLAFTEVTGKRCSAGDRFVRVGVARYNSIVIKIDFFSNLRDSYLRTRASQLITFIEALFVRRSPNAPHVSHVNHKQKLLFLACRQAMIMNTATFWQNIANERHKRWILQVIICKHPRC